MTECGGMRTASLILQLLSVVGLYCILWLGLSESCTDYYYPKGLCRPYFWIVGPPWR
jgi:hypothetical protein